jgi:transposase
MVEGTEGSHHKEGSSKMTETNTVAAGIDTGKHKLDVAIHGRSERWSFGNDPAGIAGLIKLMRRCKVTRIGIEATGGYEREAVAGLRRAGLVVVVLQPIQVRAFATYQLCRAKSDAIDAGLIAACVAHLATERDPPDPRIQPLSDLLVFIEQVEEDIARNKTRLDHAHSAIQRRLLKADVDRLKKRRASLLARLSAMVDRHDDLARRRDLVASIAGIGERTALALIIHMPELGRISREEAASLAGVAPFVHDSGQRKGERHIAGGRARLRKSVYSAALPATFRHNTQLKALYDRLVAAGKPHKVALIACVRKLIIFANTVLTRGTPWIKANAPA